MHITYTKKIEERDANQSPRCREDVRAETLMSFEVEEPREGLEHEVLYSAGTQRRTSLNKFEAHFLIP